MIQAMFSNRKEVYEAPLFGVLKFDGLALFIPEDELDAVEPEGNLGLQRNQRGRVGLYRIDELEYPLFCLDRDLHPEIPGQAHTRCALMRDTEYQFGLVCEHIDTTRREQIQLRSVPAPMLERHSPVLAIAIANGRQLGCVSTTQALQTHLQHILSMNQTFT